MTIPIHGKEKSEKSKPSRKNSFFDEYQPSTEPSQNSQQKQTNPKRLLRSPPDFSVGSIYLFYVVLNTYKNRTSDSEL